MTLVRGMVLVLSVAFQLLLVLLVCCPRTRMKSDMETG